MQNKKINDPRVSAIRATLEALDSQRPRREASLADVLPVPLARHALHETYAAAPADTAATNAFALGLALGLAAGRPILWGVHDGVEQETGRPYALGLHEMGLPLKDFLLVRARNIQTLLAVGEEGARCSALGAVVLSAWGETKAMTLTASRRLAVAANSGAAVLLARSGAAPQPSPADTRWIIAAAASTPLAAQTPGQTAFSATLSRSRDGRPSQTWIMEWDRERRSFVEQAPLSGGLVPLVAQRPAGTRATAADHSRAA